MNTSPDEKYLLSSFRDFKPNDKKRHQAIASARALQECFELLGKMRADKNLSVTQINDVTRMQKLVGVEIHLLID